MGRPIGSGRVPLEDRLWSRVDKTGDCWLWTGPVNQYGYGKIGEGGFKGKTLLVHRLVYTLMVEEIPEGMQIDHLCHTNNCGKTDRECLHRRCVNPDHLVVSSHRDNSIRDGCTESGKNLLKTHCPKGHEYNEENTRYERNRHGLFCRKCRICDRERQADIRRRKRQ